METITSKTNQYVKLARSLQEKKYRDQEALYQIEGLRLAEEALNANVNFAYAFVDERFLKSARGQALLEVLQDRAVLVYQLEDHLLRYCADTVHPQGILLIAKKTEKNKEKLLNGEKLFWFLADDLQDPGNLGTILRTAWAAGANGAILLSGGVDQYNSKVVRSSMGAVFNLPIYQAKDYQDALSVIREGGLDILTASADGDTVYNQADLAKPLVWVMGSEAHGVSEFWRDNADALVSLPMAGGAESLNVAVASGILFYETLRQRLRTGK